jgi:hypothetical protein
MLPRAPETGNKVNELKRTPLGNFSYLLAINHPLPLTTLSSVKQFFLFTCQ